MTSSLVIRPFESLQEYEACTRFQEEIWGEGFSERVSPAILKIANRIGGLSAGAFDRDQGLHGFVFGLTGIVEGRPIHWSDMLGVREEARDLGLGTRLKAFQRKVMLSRDVREMRWTFDPLQSRNAHLNFHKLGVVSHEYAEDMYGETDSPLHRGVGTDRLVASWILDSDRVLARMDGSAPDPMGQEVEKGQPVFSVGMMGGLPVSEDPLLGSRALRLLLPIPADVGLMMERDPTLAARWRASTREVFRHYLARGYEVREFVRGNPVGHYVLVREGSRRNPPRKGRQEE